MNSLPPLYDSIDALYINGILPYDAKAFINGDKNQNATLQTAPSLDKTPKDIFENKQPQETIPLTKNEQRIKKFEKIALPLMITALVADGAFILLGAIKNRKVNPNKALDVIAKYAQKVGEFFKKQGIKAFEGLKKLFKKS